MAAFPYSLPAPLVSGYGIDPIDKTLRTDMESGTARQRLRTRSRVDMVNVTWRFTAGEMAAFRAWFESKTGYNLAQYSETLGATWWVKSAGGVGVAPVVTSNVGVAPDGQTTADQVVFSLTTGTTSTDRSDLTTTGASVIGVDYGASVWMRSADASTYTVRADFTNNIGGANMAVTPAWQKFSIYQAGATVTTTGIRPLFRLRGGLGTSSAATVLIWGLQWNAGPVLPYVPVLAAGPGVDGISFGSTPFDITLPLGNSGPETRVARFVGAPKHRAIAAGLVWEVTAQLEVR